MKKYFLCMVALLSLAIVACESDDTAPAPAVRPTFDLIDAQPDVTSAVVAANIESKGEVPISEVGFSYQEAGGEYVDVVCTNFKDGLARQTLTGLKPDTEYRWYCYAVLGGERFNASLSKTFRTLKEGEVPPAPTPQFGKPSASEVQATSALLACAYLYTGDAADIAEAGFGYKPAASAQTGYTMVEITPDDSSLSARLEELTPETAYEFYAYLVIDGKNYTSERVVFTTLKEGEQPGAPQFETPSSSGVSPTGATLACVYEYEGDGDVAEAGFGYKAGAQEEYTEVKAASTASPLTYELNGLEPETKYDFYAYVVIGDERYTSAVAQFTTLKAGENPEPEFGPVAATDVTASSATLTGSFTYEGEETVGIEVGFAYKASGETDYATKTVTASSGDKSAAITGLSAATTYTFHLYASIGGKQYRSQEGTFTTESGTVPPRKTFIVPAGPNCRWRSRTATTTMRIISVRISMSAARKPAIIRSASAPSTTVRSGWPLRATIVTMEVPAVPLTVAIRIFRPTSSTAAPIPAVAVTKDTCLARPNALSLKPPTSRYSTTRT